MDARRERVAAIAQSGSQQMGRFDFRLGSLADIRLRHDVRFTPKGQHWNSIEECPLSGKSQLE